MHFLRGWFTGYSPLYSFKGHSMNAHRKIPRMGPWRAALLAAALALSACGGGKDVDEPGSAAVSPAIPTGIGTCVPVRVTPQDGTSAIASNTAISVAYKADKAKQCTSLSLTDGAGREIATRSVNAAEWASPIGGVIGALTVVPTADLQGHAQYRILLQGQAVGAFSTGAATVKRGAYVSALDQAAQFGDLPQSATIPASAINDSVSAFIADMSHTSGIAAKLIEEVFRLEVPHLVSPNARYGAHIKRLTYTSTRADGTPVSLSGLLVYPENPDGSPFDYSQAPVFLGQHGSRDSDADAPSTAKTHDVLLGILAAGRGCVYFEPDLIGLGDTADLPQAWLVGQDTASASRDMLMAVREYFSRAPARELNAIRSGSGAALGNDIYIAGASQGGYSSFASLPQVAADTNVRGIYVADGPYNLFQTFSSNLLALAGAPRDAYAAHEDFGFIPGHLRDLLAAFKSYGGLQYDDARIFQADGSLTPGFLQDYRDNKVPDINFQLGLNSIVGSSVAYTAPNAKVVLFHHEADSLVPAQNTVDMQAFLENGSHRLASVERGSCHENSAFVKLLVGTSRSPQATHVACVAFWLDRILADI